MLGVLVAPTCEVSRVVFDGLPWFVWIVLGPLMLVVGLGAVAAAIVVLLGFVGVGSDVIHGWLSSSPRYRAWVRKRAHRADRAALARGEWPLAKIAHDGKPSIARVWAPVVAWRRPEAIGSEHGRYAIADEPSGESVWLVCVDEGYRVECGPRRWSSLEAWLSEVHARAVEHWLGSGTSDSAEASRHRADAGTDALARLLGVSPPSPSVGWRSALEQLDTCGAELPYRLLSSDEARVSYEEVLASYLDACDFDPPLSEADIVSHFPEHPRARSWRLIGEPFVVDHAEGHEPEGQDGEGEAHLFVDEENLRFVELRFAETGAWRVGDFPDLESFAHERFLRPAAEAALMRVEMRWRSALGALER